MIGRAMPVKTPPANSSCPLSQNDCEYSSTGEPPGKQVEAKIGKTTLALRQLGVKPPANELPDRVWRLARGSEGSRLQ